MSLMPDESSNKAGRFGLSMTFDKVVFFTVDEGKSSIVE